jgi:hypothetical protein
MPRCRHLLPASFSGDAVTRDTIAGCACDSFTREQPIKRAFLTLYITELYDRPTNRTQSEQTHLSRVGSSRHVWVDGSEFRLNFTLHCALCQEKAWKVYKTKLRALQNQ